MSYKKYKWDIKFATEYICKVLENDVPRGEQQEIADEVKNAIDAIVNKAIKVPKSPKKKTINLMFSGR